MRKIKTKSILACAVLASVLAGGFGLGVSRAEAAQFTYSIDDATPVVWNGTSDLIGTGITLKVWGEGANSSYSIYGGYDGGSGTITGKTVIFNSGSVGAVYGGYSATGPAGSPNDGNEVDINGGTVTNVYGGYGGNGAHYNVVKITGGDVINVYGGYGLKDGFACYNTVELRGGKIEGNVYGGYAQYEQGTVQSLIHDNKVKISGGNLSGASVYGWGGGIVTTHNNNTLQIENSVTVKEIGNFNIINFVLPQTVADNTKILTMSNAVDLSGVAVNVYLNGESPEYITLIDNVTGSFNTDNPYVVYTGADSTTEKTTAYTITVAGSQLVLKDSVPWYKVGSEEIWLHSREEVKSISDVNGDVTVYRGAGTDNAYKDINVGSHTLTVAGGEKVNSIQVTGNLTAGALDINEGKTFKVNGSADVGQVTLGTGATVIASGVFRGNNMFSVGSNNTLGAVNTVALGSNAVVSGENSIAIGNNSVAFEKNTVSVGSSGAERRIVNVANGTADNDAVNLKQLNATQAELNERIAMTEALTEAKADATKTELSQRISPYITDSGLSANGSQIQNLAAGTADNDAATYGQVKGAFNSASLSGTTLTLTPIAGNATAIDLSSLGGTGGGTPDFIAYGPKGEGFTSPTAENSTDSLAIGNGATVGNGATSSNAIGKSATVGIGAVSSNAIGSGAKVENLASYSNAIGSGATVKGGGIYSNVIGYGAISGGYSSNAIGNGAIVGGGASSSNAIGSGATVEEGASFSNAFGYNAKVAMGVCYSNAIGNGAISGGYYSNAIGLYATTNTSGSVALGAWSVASRTGLPTGVYELSIGRPALTDETTYSDGGKNAVYRVITNVADGTDVHDAVTLGQMGAAIAKITSGGQVLNLSLSDDNKLSLTSAGVAIGTVDLSDLAGGGTVDAYTKTETDIKLAAKANVADVYTKTEVDTALGNKANTADVYAKTETYSKTEVDTELAKKANSADVYTKEQTYSKTEADTTFTTKSYVDSAIEAVSGGIVAPEDKKAAFGTDNEVAKEATAIGHGNKVTGQNSVAVGAGHQIAGKNSGAFGDPTYIDADNSYAIGNSNMIKDTAEGSFVMGNNVTVTSQNAVVLGNESEDGGDNTVSVGSAELQRKIVNVADGEYAHDAATYGQLVQTAGQLSSQIDRMGTRISKVGAGAAALAAMHPVYDPESKLTFSAGVGNYKSETAAAVGLFYRFDDRVMLNFGASVGNDNDMYNMGLNFALGRHTPKGMPTRQVMYQQLISLQTLLNEQKAENAAMHNENSTMRELLLKQSAENAAIKEQIDAQKAQHDAQIAQLLAMIEELKNR